jgi:L-fuconolactonase
MSKTPETDPGLVDAHIHLWDTRAFDLPWLVATPQLAPRYTPADFAEQLAAVRLRAAVVVQAGESATEATWLLPSAANASALTGAEVGVVLQYAPSIDRLAGPWDPVVFDDDRAPKGVRLPLYDQPAEWSMLAGVESLATYLEHQGLILELLVRPDQLGATGEIAAKHPRLRIVLCHLGLGELDPDENWRTGIGHLAARKNVMAKISGIHTSRAPTSEDHVRARRAAGWATEQWGSDRLMFGSDWPMSTRAGTYLEVLEWTKQALSGSSPSELQAILTQTALSTYGLGPSEPFKRLAVSDDGTLER